MVYPKGRSQSESQKFEKSILGTIPDFRKIGLDPMASPWSPRQHLKYKIRDFWYLNVAFSLIPFSSWQIDIFGLFMSV